VSANGMKKHKPGPLAGRCSLCVKVVHRVCSAGSPQLHQSFTHLPRRKTTKPALLARTINEMIRRLSSEKMAYVRIAQQP
jgi:hypothetical protein